MNPPAPKNGMLPRVIAVLEKFETESAFKVEVAVVLVALKVDAPETPATTRFRPMSTRPAIEEVAVVDVARRAACVGVDEATTAPLPSVERIMFPPSPEKVGVPVEVKLPTVSEPEMSASPCTERSLDGEEVPKPVFPPKNCAA